MGEFVKILIFTAFVSAAGQAASPYWEYPAISFPPSIPVDNICYTGTDLRTIKPVEVCTEISVVARWACYQDNQTLCRKLKDGELPRAAEILKEETRCTAREARILETPRVYKVNECAKWQMPFNPETGQPVCVAWQEVEKKHPLTFTIKLIDNSGEQSFRTVAVKKFALPLCN